MKIKFLILFLIASLAINAVFFIKMSSRTDVVHNKTEKREAINRPIIKGIPDLSETQRSEMRKIIKEFKITLSEYKNQILAKRIDIIDELSNPDFNIEDLKKSTEELNKNENELNLYFVESLGKISSIMNPEQRMKLLIKFSRHWFFLKNKKSRRRLK